MIGQRKKIIYKNHKKMRHEEIGKEKKIIPFRKALAIFILWTALLSITGYFTYVKILKPYIVDKPTIIEVKMPAGR